MKRQGAGSGRRVCTRKQDWAGGVRNPRLGLQGVNFPELQATGWRRVVQGGCGPYTCLFTLPSRAFGSPGGSVLSPLDLGLHTRGLGYVAPNHIPQFLGL